VRDNSHRRDFCLDHDEREVLHGTGAGSDAAAVADEPDGLVARKGARVVAALPSMLEPCLQASF
jgi:hypothetical protein